MPLYRIIGAQAQSLSRDGDASPPRWSRDWCLFGLMMRPHFQWQRLKAMRAASVHINPGRKVHLERPQAGFFRISSRPFQCSICRAPQETNRASLLKTSDFFACSPVVDRAAVELVGIAQLQGVVGGDGPLKALHLPKPQFVSDHKVDGRVRQNGGPGGQEVV